MAAAGLSPGYLHYLAMCPHRRSRS
jgi:hypothetical protein